MSSTSSITVRTAQPRMNVDPGLYGIFLEDINRAVDGGLYPELLRDRTFEDSILPPECTAIQGNGREQYAFVTESGWRDEFNGGEGLSKWVRENGIPDTPIPAWYAERATMRLDPEHTLNRNRQVSLDIRFDEGGVVRNIGFNGVPQKAGEQYHLYFFAEGEADLTFEVRNGEDGTVVGETTGIRVHGDSYVRYDLEYTAKETILNGVFEIHAAGAGKLRLGFISLMPADTFKGHGLRRDIAEKLEALHPGFFRFPGGCIVEGFTVSTAMRFANTIGPVWERPGHLLMWHYRSYDAIGFHEYLQFCEDLHMDACYVVNCGMTCQARCEVYMEGEEQDAMLADCLAAIEYATGSADSEYGQIRAKMGHPEPFRLPMIEIGNENWGEGYEERYERWFAAIREKYPDIRLIANSHLEKTGHLTEVVDEHYYDTAEWFAEHTQYFDDYDREGPDIFLGEVSVVRGYTGQLYGALGEAAFLTGIEKNQDIVRMVSYAPLLENVHYRSWFPNLIRFDGGRSFGIPSYYVWKIFMENRGEKVVDIKTQTGRITRPSRGIFSVSGAPGLVMTAPVWNGRELRAEHNILGHLVPQTGSDGKVLQEADKEQLQEAALHNIPDQKETLIVFGPEERRAGTLSFEFLGEAGRSYSFGFFPYRMPDIEYVADETNPPADWNVENTKAFVWTMRDGKSIITDEFDANGKAPKVLDEQPVTLAEGRHAVCYETDLERFRIYLDEKLLHDIPLPSFPVISAAAQTDGDDIILKIVNMGEEAEDVRITLDCDVRGDYLLCEVSGGREDGNSFEEPFRISDRRRELHGADREFTFPAAALSANVLRLHRKD